jgi:hypothetical protein
VQKKWQKNRVFCLLFVKLLGVNAKQLFLFHSLVLEIAFGFQKINFEK